MRSEYFSLCLFEADSIPFSQGIVSSVRSVVLALLDHNTVFGLRLLLEISPGSQSFLPRSTLILQSRVVGTTLDVAHSVALVLPLLSQADCIWWPAGEGWRLLKSCLRLSKTSASLLRTWMCRHLLHPWDSTTLQPDRMCWTTDHRCRFSGQGGVLYVA